MATRRTSCCRVLSCSFPPFVTRRGSWRGGGPCQRRCPLLSLRSRVGRFPPVTGPALCRACSCPRYEKSRYAVKPATQHASSCVWEKSATIFAPVAECQPNRGRRSERQNVTSQVLLIRSTRHRCSAPHQRFGGIRGGIRARA